MEKFSELQLGAPLQKGLGSGHFLDMTAVQASAIPLALSEKDLWVTSPTGSGKTLCFLVPLLEGLHRKKWSHSDGLGGLVLVPTRELAVQIFDVLKMIGKNFKLSAGLLIGGRNFSLEAKSLAGINILVATPGRLLHHLDKTAGFSAANLHTLVIDEVDLLFEMGFSKATKAILSSLPGQKQVLLFSATASPHINQFVEESVRPSACVVVKCTKNNEVATAPFSEARNANNHLKGDSIPKGLKNTVLRCDIKDKATFLFSFLRKHSSSKVLVFFSTCKEVRFFYESFSKLRPGIPLCHIHGKQKQLSRTKTYYKFCSAKTGALLTTDICSRGLDFPKIDVVVNFDCPDTFDLFVHRVGRTARYNAEGTSLLLVCGFEVKFLEALASNGVVYSLAKPPVLDSLGGQLAKVCLKYPEIKHLAERAFISHLRSVFLLHGKDKSLFDQINLAEYSSSLGLPNTPYIRNK